MQVKLGQRVVPCLLVSDMRETLDFYINSLGFTQTGYYPIVSDPEWTEVRRDGVALHFYAESPHGTRYAPICSGIFYFYPESVVALADELRDKVQFAWPLHVTDAGMREFRIRDPNGYVLAFVEPATAESSVPNSSAPTT
jgi:lactoylglutathione lyase